MAEPAADAEGAKEEGKAGDDDEGEAEAAPQAEAAASGSGGGGAETAPPA